MELITAQPATDTPDDPTCNPRAELDALERAHMLIANAASQRILEHGYAIEELRPIEYEHRAKVRPFDASLSCCRRPGRQPTG